jgi:hypothetical protein
VAFRPDQGAATGRLRTFTLDPVFTRDHGHLPVDRISALMGALDADMPVFLCGPAALIGGLRRDLRRHGIHATRARRALRVPVAIPGQQCTAFGNSGRSGSACQSCDHAQVTRWIRHYFDEDDTLSYYEIGEDGHARRQVDLQGADRRPVTAAILDEVLHARDQGGTEAVRAYECRYGVVAEGALNGWQDVDQVVEISPAEFEQAWTPARQALEQSQ